MTVVDDMAGCVRLGKRKLGELESGRAFDDFGLIRAVEKISRLDTLWISRRERLDDD